MKSKQYNKWKKKIQQRNTILKEHDTWLEIYIGTPKFPNAIMFIDKIDWKILQYLGYGRVYASTPVAKNKKKTTHTLYAIVDEYIGNRRSKHHSVHRLILLNTNMPSEKEVDHRNGNGLDNRRCNIRACVRKENTANTRIPSNNTSGVKGVHFYKSRNKWIAYIEIDGVRSYLGYFKTKEEASKIRKLAERLWVGEYSCISPERTSTNKEVGYIAIDNGTSGSIAIKVGNFYNFMKTPIFKETSYTKKNQNITRLDTGLFYDIIEDVANHVDRVEILIERPLVNPRLFVSSMSALRCLEATLVILNTINIKYNNIYYKYIDSRMWQGCMIPKATVNRGNPEKLKEASTELALVEFPQFTELLLKHDGDSLCMLMYMISNSEASREWRCPV